MSLSNHQKLLLLSGVIALLMVALAFSLPNLEMRPGETIPLQGQEQSPAGGGGLGEAPWFIMIIRGILALGIILLPIYILINLFTPQGRRRLLADVLLIVVLLLVASWLAEQQLPANDQAQSIEEQFGAPSLAEGEATGQNPPEFEAQTQPWMIAATIIGVALLVAAFAFLAIRRYFLRRAPRRTYLEEFADHAQQALADMQIGADFTDVVIRCYAQMSQVLQTERGIQRPQSMTTYEFEQELLARGFPPRPVRLLTQLFERVRYGHQPVNENEKRAASEGLVEIILFCRGQYE